MKCRKCENKAVINMRQHKLALCEEHFKEWFLLQTERAIEKYKMFKKEDRVLVAVSGGKDSLSLWDALWRLDYQIEGLYIHLGIEPGEYSSKSYRFALEFARKRGLSLNLVDLKGVYGYSITELSKKIKRSVDRPCAQCGLAKRYLMNKYALDHGFTVLVTGHNLDDETAVLLANTLRWSIDLIPRQSPVLMEKTGFVRKTKPFCRFHERETAVYAFLQEIDYIYEECPHAGGNKALIYKELLNRLEDKMPGSKLAFYQNFLNAKKSGFIDKSETDEPEATNLCIRCGQPTTKDLCAFCKLLETAGQELTSSAN